MDKITLTGMKFYGYHGCLEKEKAEGQDFFVDAVLYLDTYPAGRADDLALTVNYAEVYEIARAVVEGTRKNLIEAVAEDIAGRVLHLPRLTKVTVTVHKPHAPLPGPFADAAVTITRERP